MSHIPFSPPTESWPLQPPGPTLFFFALTTSHPPQPTAAAFVGPDYARKWATGALPKLKSRSLGARWFSDTQTVSCDLCELLFFFFLKKIFMFFFRTVCDTSDFSQSPLYFVAFLLFVFFQAPLL